MTGMRGNKTLTIATILVVALALVPLWPSMAAV